MGNIRYNIEVDEATDGKVTLYGQQRDLVKPSGEVNKSATALELMRTGLDSAKEIERLKSQLEQRGLQGAPQGTVYDDARRELDKMKDAAGLAGIDTSSGASMLKSSMDIYLAKRELDDLRAKFAAAEKELGEAKSSIEEMKGKASAKQNIKDMIEVARPMMPYIGAIMEGRPLPLSLGAAEEMPESHAFGEELYKAFSDDIEALQEAIQIFYKKRPLLKAFLEQMGQNRESHAA